VKEKGCKKFGLFRWHSVQCFRLLWCHYSLAHSARLYALEKNHGRGASEMLTVCTYSLCYWVSAVQICTYDYSVAVDIICDIQEAAYGGDCLNR